MTPKHTQNSVELKLLKYSPKPSNFKKNNRIFQKFHKILNQLIQYINIFHNEQNFFSIIYLLRTSFKENKVSLIILMKSKSKLFVISF